MECDSVRRHLLDGGTGGAVAAHLQECASCRAEAELAGRMVAAVRSLPRVSAPEALIGRVMAELRAAAPARGAARALPPLLLRPWELGWLGAVCLSLLTLGSLFQSARLLSAWGSAGSAIRNGGEALQSLGRSLGESVPEGVLDQGRVVRVVHETAAAAAGMPVTWLLALLGFGAALVWLLSRHGETGPRREWEDAHA